MTDQEQTPLDLAEGERLLADKIPHRHYKERGHETLNFWCVHCDCGEYCDVSCDCHCSVSLEKDSELALECVTSPNFYRDQRLGFVVLALVAVLKAAQQTKVGSSTLDVCTCDEPHYQCREHGAAVAQLRDDLVRVERQAETDNEWLQARIAELEVLVAERHPELAYAKADVDGMVQRIAELEGSLRESVDELARRNPDRPFYKSHTEERALAVLEPQTPTAS